jgi:YHS domain-containing protein
MERDPVCGTFVVPERAVSLAEASGRMYFCSAACRDRYRANPPAHPHPPSARDEYARGRTA